MKKFNILIVLLLTLNLYAQEKKIRTIEWFGVKKMNKNFMEKFIETKVNSSIDTLKINRDINALTRLNGVSNITYKLIEINTEEVALEFYLLENFSLLPNIQLWTSDETNIAYRIGFYDYNFLGKNSTIGGYYQNNNISSFGVFFAAPYLFSPKWGLETSVQKLATIEPININGQTAKYTYENKSVELLGAYRYNDKLSFKFGPSIFNEKYQYNEGATSPDVPQFFDVDKFLFKFIADYNTQQFDFYLVKGIRNLFNTQFVASNNVLQNNFSIFWNDFSWYKRYGKTGNFANRVRIGLASNSNSPFAPFSLDNNLNIRGVGNIIDRGTGTLVWNTEYRQTLFQKKWFVLQGNAFVDSGTWRTPGKDFNDFFNQDNFRVYPGIGLRFIHKTIFNATFRIDYGFGITKNASSGLVFGIGQYF
jgi:hypothetical protein